MNVINPIEHWVQHTRPQTNWQDNNLAGYDWVGVDADSVSLSNESSGVMVKGNFLEFQHCGLTKLSLNLITGQLSVTRDCPEESRKFWVKVAKMLTKDLEKKCVERESISKAKDLLHGRNTDITQNISFSASASFQPQMQGLNSQPLQPMSFGDHHHSITPQLQNEYTNGVFVTVGQSSDHTCSLDSSDNAGVTVSSDGTSGVNPMMIYTNGPTVHIDPLVGSINDQPLIMPWDNEVSEYNLYNFPIRHSGKFLRFDLKKRVLDGSSDSKGLLEINTRDMSVKNSHNVEAFCDTLVKLFWDKMICIFRSQDAIGLEEVKI